MTRDEAVVIDRLYSTIRAEDESLQPQVVQKAIEILDMPFLDTVESPDAMAVRSLESFEDAGSAEFLELMTHPTLSDGITDEEAKIVALLSSTNKYKSELVPVLLDGTSVFKEERTINLPHSGEVLLAIIRFREQTSPSPNMGYLEHAVRHHEGFMGKPLPTNYVAWYFVDYVSSGRHVGTHIESNPERDPAVGEYWRAPRHAAHEAAHYYWRNSAPWISEGGADMLVILSENARVGRPLAHNRKQCIWFNTISEIADAESGIYEYSCSYRLGQRLFLDLYHALGEATFRQAFRSLYLKQLRDDPTDYCASAYLGICHVAAAFKAGASDDVAAKVDELIGHWYYGRTETHEADRAELVALYHATGGAGWTDSANWLSDVHIGAWYGVATDADGRVIELDLAENGLSGELPPGLSNLASLRELLLSDNRLNGQIPTELGRLDNLTRLELDDNRLTGTIPASLSNLAALRYLRLAGANQFSGCVPIGWNDVAANDLANLGLPFC